MTQQTIKTPSRYDYGTGRIMRENCVVIDVETTGLDPTQHRIIEIAAVKYLDGHPIARLNTLINPGDWKPVPEEITKLTGIFSEMIVDAPSFDRVADILQGMVEHSLVVGHNVAFDLSFIDAELEHYGFPPLKDYKTLDTKAFAQHISLLNLPVGEDGRKHYRLFDVAKALNVPQPRTHRAIDDVQTTFKVYQELRRAEALEQGFWGY